jgi:hypothetical protein
LHIPHAKERKFDNKPDGKFGAPSTSVFALKEIPLGERSGEQGAGTECKIPPAGKSEMGSKMPSPPAPLPEGEWSLLALPGLGARVGWDKIA